jgi:hypothetical protein
MILPIITDAHGDVHGKRETPLVTRTANVIITKNTASLMEQVLPWHPREKVFQSRDCQYDVAAGEICDLDEHVGLATRRPSVRAIRLVKA